MSDLMVYVNELCRADIAQHRAGIVAKIGTVFERYVYPATNYFPSWVLTIVFGFFATSLPNLFHSKPKPEEETTARQSSSFQPATAPRKNTRSKAK